MDTDTNPEEQREAKRARANRLATKVVVVSFVVAIGGLLIAAAATEIYRSSLPPSERAALELREKREAEQRAESEHTDLLRRMAKEPFEVTANKAKGVCMDRGLEGDALVACTAQMMEALGHEMTRAGVIQGHGN